MSSQQETARSRILVIGGGFSGLTAAVDAAETGAEVILVEKNAYLGGRVAQLNKYFPKLCPPACGLEINFRRIKTNPLITVYTMSEVESISGSAGDFTVTIKHKPKYVNANCVSCNACSEVCPVERSNDFNFGLDKTKAIYLTYNQAFPQLYVIDDTVCKKTACNKCVEVCKYNAIDLNATAQTTTVKVGAIVNATGWNPYDYSKIDNLNPSLPNVISNMMMERLASVNGPTEGKILRPSDNTAPQSIAFIQCAGSRDENHLEFCSYICCMASLKQTRYIREQYPDAKVYIFYIDIRTPGKYEQFYWKVKEDPNVIFVKGKVAKIEEAPNGDVTVVAEDILTGQKTKTTVNMAVLATGMEPSAKSKPVASINYGSDGFAGSGGGIFSAGCAKNAMDVAKSSQDATGAALKAIQTAKGR